MRIAPGLHSYHQVRVGAVGAAVVGGAVGAAGAGGAAFAAQEAVRKAPAAPQRPAPGQGVVAGGSACHRTTNEVRV